MADPKKTAARARRSPKGAAARVQEVVETTREAPAQLALPVPPAVETPAAAAMKAIEGAVEAARPLEAAVPAPVMAAVETVRTVLGAGPKADEIVAPAARLV